MTNEPESQTSQRDSRIKRIAIFAIIVVVAFLLGLIPMWIKAWSRASERDAAQKQLRLCNLQMTLATAAISARKGEYETARRSTSDFFIALHNQIEATNGPSDLTTQQRETLRPLMNGRDDLITLLARGDPASADRLSDLYANYVKVLGNQKT